MAKTLRGERRAEYQRAYRRKRIADGLCPQCGKANDRQWRTLCSRCAEDQNRKRTERNRQKKKK